MTHAEKIAFLRGRDEETVAPWVVAKVLGGDPYWYTIAARAGKLDLPFTRRRTNAASSSLEGSKSITPYCETSEPLL